MFLFLYSVLCVPLHTQTLYVLCAMLWNYIVIVLWVSCTSHSCWITDDSFFYSLNLVYFTLIFIFNSGILMAVASSICQMKQGFRSNSKLGDEAKGKTWRDADRLSESCQSGLTVLGLTCLMGITWGLAFLGSGYVNYPILYLFCILNSTQGLLSCVCLC